MTALSIQPTYPIFTDIDGQPLEDGYVWIGVANLAPIVNPITVYWDAALTIPAAQPIRTRGGYPINSGTPARLYVNSDYSIQVQNRNGSVVYSAPEATEIYSEAVIGQINASQVNFLQDATGAVIRTVQNRLEDTVCVFDFMTLAQINDVKNETLLINVTTEILAALNSGAKNVYFPQGKYRTNATIDRPNTVRMYGDGAGYSTIVAYHNNSIIRTAPVALSGDAYNSMEDMGVKNGPTFNSTIGIELLNLNQPSFKRIRIEQGPLIGMQQQFVLNGEFEEISIIDCTDIGLYLFSTGLATGTNRNVFQCISMIYNDRGIVVDLNGGLNNVFNDVAIEASTSYPIEIVDVDQITFNGLYLEGNAQSIWCRGGDFVTFRDCFNVSAIPFIRGAPNFVTSRVYVERLFDLSGSGVGTNGDFMGMEYGQIRFPATAAITTQPNTLDDYEEGTWVPFDNSGAGLTLSTGVCKYTKIGRLVQCNFIITYPSTASSAAVIVGGLPFLVKGTHAVSVGLTTVATLVRGLAADDETYFVFYNATGGFILNSDVSGTTIRGTIVYDTNA
jgi:hypothetical protein